MTDEPKTDETLGAATDKPTTDETLGAATDEPKTDETLSAVTDKPKTDETFDQTANQKTNETLNVGDWIVVQFEVSGKGATRNYLGKILEMKGEDSYYVTFVRCKRTREYDGYVYSFPHVPDESDCTKEQILYKVREPVEYRRGALQFDVHEKEI